MRQTKHSATLKSKMPGRSKPGHSLPGHSMPGQGMNEYILIGGLVAVVGILSLTALGNNVNGLFTNMIGQNPNANNANALTTGAGSVAGQAPNPNLASNANTGGNGNTQNLFQQGVREVEMTLPNGQALRVNIPNGANLMETVGPNGVTEEYLASMVKYIEGLRSSLPANDPLQGQLAQLANLGHRVKTDQFSTISQIMSSSPFDSSGLATLPNIGSLVCTAPNCSKSSNGTALLAAAGGVESNTNLTQFFTLNEALKGAMEKRGMAEQYSLLSYFSGNIVNTANLVNERINSAGSDGLKTTVGGLSNLVNSAASVGTNQRTAAMVVEYERAIKAMKSTPYIEANANHICDMSAHTTCYQANGVPVGSNPTRQADLPAVVNSTVTPVGVGAGAGAGKSK